VKEINADSIQNEITRQLIKASTTLEPSLMKALQAMKAEYEGFLEQEEIGTVRYQQLHASHMVLSMILENLTIAETNKMPMCQDTGMFIAFVDVGPQSPYSMKEIEQIIERGASEAVKRGHFRHSIVTDPLFSRENTKTNLPFVIHWGTQSKKALSIHFLLKGFGSENCSAMRMLSPTTSVESLIDEVTQMVMESGGKPCPPIVVGVGIGGSAEMSGVLAKRALLRDVGNHNSDPRYGELEKSLLKSIQSTEIGPGGFGGPLTALWVGVEFMGTHIAGLPVSVAISCWADRKAHIEL
jgi:fumarate hydratase subunit alpha